MISRSPRRFLERRGLVDTNRKPMSTTNFNALRIRDYPLDSPLPLVEYQKVTQGKPPPDRGPSAEWPG